ncbi:MAG: DUF11 domain-containing protein [Methanomicrobiales archaeon]|nr:DUF11 domain-containing protein [Methanomicrobiales archaeon]
MDREKYGRGCMQVDAWTLGNRKKLIFLAAFLVLTLFICVAAPVRADKQTNYISIGMSSSDIVCTTTNPWTLCLSPANETNILPDETDQIFTITLIHKVETPSCENKEINVTTTLGTFRESGLPYFLGTTDSACGFTATVTYNAPGETVITARKSNPKVEVETNMTWNGTAALPFFTMQVTSDPFLLNGENASFVILANNTGNVPLSALSITVKGSAAHYVGGDTNMDGTFDPAEIWQYAYSAPTSWVQGNTTYDIQASAFYKTTSLIRNTSFGYTGLLIGKQIVPQKFNNTYLSLPFNVTAKMTGESSTYGPFQIQVNESAKITVQNSNWMFTETGREVTDPYPGNLTPQDGTLTYQPGDATTLSFVNTFQYLPLLMYVNLTEHTVEMNLSANETVHTFTAIVTDQYSEPFPYLELTFAGEFDTGHTAINTYTNGAGVAEVDLNSTVPQQVVIYAFRDANDDTYFNDTEIGDSCTITWNYIPTPASFSLQGASNVTNYLDNREFDHTFTLILRDQYNIPMEGKTVNYTVEYQNGQNLTSSAVTDGNGTINITVSSQVPDVAHINASVEGITAQMTKTWTYEIPPTTLTFTKTAMDVNGGQLVVGDLIRYTLTVNNTGDVPAYNVIVMDSLPEGITCVDVNGLICTNPIMWEIGNLSPGSSEQMTVNVTINTSAAGQSIINSGKVSGENIEPVTPPQVCLDGNAPVGGVCAVRPLPPEVPPTPPIQPASETETSHTGTSHGSVSVGSIRSLVISIPPQVGTTCGADEYYVEGRGCVRCGPNETFINGECVKNITPLIPVEIPPTPTSGILSRILTLLTIPFLFIALIALLAYLLARWWKQREERDVQEQYAVPKI